MILKERYMMIGSSLILADLHLGKTTHFRKAGLPIPAMARDADQSNLLQILRNETPESVFVLGDLFHSSSNKECDELAMITSQFPEVHFELVLGNHDILEESDYRSMDFETCTQLELGDLILTHEPLESVPEGKLNIHGHIHPGVRMVGKGRQSLLMPCFHLYKQHFCLPAFGALTGLMRQKPKTGDEVFAILSGDVVRVF
jgi:uncharacterized protein